MPVVVLTATDDENTGLQAVQSGAQDYLVKGQFSAAALDRSIVYSIERHRLHQTLRQLAVVDELTGLYNRRGFNTLNPDLMQRLRTGVANGFLICFDLDRFKSINDNHGHSAGDAALVEFATILRNAFRKDGLFARLGGDEFLTMGIEAAPGAAVESLRVLEELLEARNAAGTSPFRLEASSGLLLLESSERRSLEELLAAADAELYRNKEARHAGRPVSPPPVPPSPVSRVQERVFDYPWQEIVHRLSLMAAAFEAELEGHHARVAAVAAKIACRLGLPAERVERIRVAASVHDVGKVGVPVAVLNHSGRLEGPDLDAVRTHTRIGHRLLAGSDWPELRCAAEVALSHHEWWDGTGYPDGLRGPEIPLEARIVAIADVYDALRTERSYKDAWSEDRVLAELRAGRGTKFDPDCLDAFFAEFGEGGSQAGQT